GSKSKKALKDIAYVPQKGEVNWELPTTVLDVVLMGRYVHKGWIKRPNKKDHKIAISALREMKMEAFRNRQISELSGGQRQRVFLARAVCQDAEIYIMYETLQRIDITTEKLIIKTIKSPQEQGKTFLVVHHNLDTVKEYFDHVIIMNKTIFASGKFSEVWTAENIDKAYSEVSAVK